MNAELRSRLDNMKFNEAALHLDGEPEEVQEIVRALSAHFGDCGIGLGGTSHVLANAVVNLLLERHAR